MIVVTIVMRVGLRRWRGVLTMAAPDAKGHAARERRGRPTLLTSHHDRMGIITQVSARRLLRVPCASTSGRSRGGNTDNHECQSRPFSLLFLLVASLPGQRAIVCVVV